MKELKCPHCGKTFQVDEADYESIVSQIRNDEFRDEPSDVNSKPTARHLMPRQKQPISGPWVRRTRQFQRKIQKSSA